MTLKVRVSGLPPDATKDELELFFESPTFCPFAENVSHIEILPDGSCIVTFEEEIDDHKLTGSFKLRGHYLNAVPYSGSTSHSDDHFVEAAEEFYNADYFSDNSKEIGNESSFFDQKESDDDSDKENDMWGFGPLKDGNTSEASDEVKNQEETQDEERGKVSEDRSEKNKEGVQSESYEIKSPAKETKIVLEDLPPQNAPNLQTPPPSDCSSDDRNVIGEMKLNLEKLKLIKLMSNTKKLDLAELTGCKVSFDEENSKLIFSGKVDRSMEATLKLHELMAEWTNSRVKIEAEKLKIMISERGQSWFNSKLSDRGLCTVFYAKNDIANFIASCDENLKEANVLIDDLLIKKSIPVSENQKNYLKSKIWAKYVESLHASKLVELKQSSESDELVLIGGVDDVSETADDVIKLLKENSDMSKKIVLSTGQAHLLEANKEKIKASLLISCGNENKAKLEYESDCVHLSGLEDDVIEMEKILQDNFISKICSDKLESTEPGLTAGLFTTEKSEEEEILDTLKLRHNCVIEVSEGIPTVNLSTSPGNIHSTSSSKPPSWLKSIGSFFSIWGKKKKVPTATLR